jgi:hypothetical protein
MLTPDVLMNSLKDSVISIFKDPSKLSTVERNDLYKTLEYAIDMNRKFSTVFNSLSTSDLYLLKDKFQAKIAESKNSFTSKAALNIINLYFNGLRSSAKTIDKTLGPFASLNKSTVELVNILTKIKSRFNEYFTSSTITINDVRLSAISVINFIHASEILCCSAEYLLSLVLDTVTGIISPKYRYTYLEAHLSTAMRLLNEMIEHQGIYNIVNAIDTMKREGSDANISSGNQPYNFSFISKIGNVIKSFFVIDKTSPVVGIGLFRRIGEVYDNYLHEKYLKNQNRLEWMQSRVALFKADMIGMSPDSPEYQKLVKIVEVYDTEINKLDKTINEYLNEE